MDELFPTSADHQAPALVPGIYLPERAPRCRPGYTYELRAQLIREVYTPNPLCDTPAAVAAYLREHVHTAPWYDPDREAFIVVLVNTRRRIIGHCLVSLGLLDTVLIHAREVFRPAIAGAASAIILAHNHPGGDPSPSDADIRTTRDLMRAGDLLKIQVLDHVITGTDTHRSLRELGLMQL